MRRLQLPLLDCKGAISFKEMQERTKKILPAGAGRKRMIIIQDKIKMMVIGSTE